MRIILKFLAAPFVFLLSLVLGVLTLLHTLTTGVLSILALIAATCGLFACTIGGDPASGVRVLIVHGTKDAIVNHNYSRQAQRAYPNAKLHIIEGGAHGFSKKHDAIAIAHLKRFAGRDKK